MVFSHSLRIIALSFNSLKDHERKVALIKSFLKELHLMTQNHGSGYTIKYLKACHVALQRLAGGQPLKTLRSIEPDLPLPRLETKKLIYLSIRISFIQNKAKYALVLRENMDSYKIFIHRILSSLNS